MKLDYSEGSKSFLMTLRCDIPVVLVKSQNIQQMLESQKHNYIILYI